MDKHATLQAAKEASRRNAAEEARKAQAYLLAQIAAQQAAQEQSSSHRGEEAKIERMEEAEGAALAAAKAAKPQRDEQAYQDYRAGERDAEVIAAEYQARKATQYKEKTPKEPCLWGQLDQEAIRTAQPPYRFRGRGPRHRRRDVSAGRAWCAWYRAAGRGSPLPRWRECR